MTNWKKYKLKDLCTKIGSGATPRGGKEAYFSSGISLIRSQNILDFSFSKKGLAFINDEQADELSNVIVEKDDVLLNITGDSVARVSQVPSDVLPARVNQHVAILRGKNDILNSEFLKYYLLSPFQKEKLLSLSSSGATRNALTKTMIEDFEINLPSLSEQQAIASILSSLDNKIELNHRMNKNLEQMAQEIFKKWFIDFEFPNIDGKPYKYSGGKMIDSELGYIPKGWKVGIVDDLIKIESGFPFNSSMFDDYGQYGLVTIKNVQDGAFVTECTNYISNIPDKMPEHCKLKDGDILLSLTGNVGRICIAYGGNYLDRKSVV